MTKKGCPLRSGADVDDLDDATVIELRCDAGLVEEQLALARGLGDVAMQQLDRARNHDAVVLDAGGLPNLTHSAAADSA